MHQFILKKWAGTLKLLSAGAISALLLGNSLAALAAEYITVTYAGSMGVVIDQAIGPAFAKQNHLRYRGQGQGAYGMANLLASRHRVADVFVSVTTGPMTILQKAGLVDRAEPVADTRMVIAYHPQGHFASLFSAAADHKGEMAWWQVLQMSGVKFGRPDPLMDPLGQNIIFSLMLAEKYYRQPGLTQRILGETINPQQIQAEGGLLFRLQSGQIDAASVYESATRSAKLPYIVLPDKINLGNPQMSA